MKSFHKNESKTFFDKYDQMVFFYFFIENCKVECDK